MESGVDILGIVPAAGRSRRMGVAKTLLPVAGRPMVLAVAKALLEGGMREVVIVASPQLADALAGQTPPEVRIAINDDPESQMIDSVRIGLRRSAGNPSGGFAVCPADAGGVQAADVRACLAAFADDPTRIVVATHAGRRGHPVILPADLAPAVLSDECDGGLNQLVRRQADRVREVACSAGCTSNINTPADYQASAGVRRDASLP